LGTGSVIVAAFVSLITGHLVIEYVCLENGHFAADEEDVAGVESVTVDIEEQLRCLVTIEEDKYC